MRMGSISSRTSNAPAPAKVSLLTTTFSTNWSPKTCLPATVPALRDASFGERQDFLSCGRSEVTSDGEGMGLGWRGFGTGTEFARGEGRPQIASPKASYFHKRTLWTYLGPLLRIARYTARWNSPSRGMQLQSFTTVK